MLDSLRQQAFERYAAGESAVARALFEQGLAQATTLGNAPDISRFHAGIGLCHTAEAHYSKALTEFQAARDWARKARGFSRSADLYASASANLALVFGRMGDFESSKRALRDGLAAGPGPEQDALMRLNLAICHTDDGPPGEAEALLRDLIGRMRASGDQRTLGRALERLGYLLTRLGRYDEAEPLLHESQQVRPDAERADPYFVLAQLRLAQGRPKEAREFLEQYAASGRQHYWKGRVNNTRGLILEASGQPELALAEYKSAVDAMRQRRFHIRPSERLLRVSETAMPELYENYIRLATQLHRLQGGPRRMAEAIAASEEIRVAFQRELYYSPERWADQHADYRKLLARLDALEAAGAAQDDPRVDRLRLALVDYEARMAADEPLLVPPPADPAALLPQLRSMVAADEAVFVFHVTSRASVAWMVTREHASSAALPLAGELRPLVARFATALREETADRTAGEELFTKIFREFSPAADTKLHWTLVLDGPLFDVPWAALPIPDGHSAGGGAAKVLIDRHSVSLLPSFFPEWKPARKEVRKLFAGFGDPVYNAADPRFSGPVPAAELARLPASATEVRDAADVWKRDGYQAEILFGRDATPAQLMKTLAERPAVLHLATHVVPGPQSEARLAFSLRNGRPELLGERELSLFRAPGAMVMMAGCASGRGNPQPVGLVGLTRAWLLSGAQAVIASLWPVPDGQAGFPARFYARVSEITKQNGSRNEAHRLAWARALRQAVVEARDSGQLPATTWAGYYLMGRI